MHLETSRPGFALPMSILIIGFLTAGVMAAYSRLDVEHEVIRGANMQVDAYAIAQAGLDQAIARRAVTPATSTFAVPGGTAEVSIQLVRPEVGEEPAMYLIRSVGLPTRSPRDPIGARHVVAQFVFWQTSKLEVKSAWTSLSGMHYNGAAGSIDGNDQCGEESALPGVMVPGGKYTYTSQNRQPAGDPPIDDSMTQQELAEHTGIDWDAIINDDAIPADYLYAANGGNANLTTGWPDFDDPNYWPVIRITGGHDSYHKVNMDGRGILIVEGHLEIDGNSQWEGVILVGGHLTANGNNNVLGATLTSLNVLLGYELEEVEVLNGTKTYAYDSCNVTQAVDALSSLRAIPNAWVDNWATYSN